MAMNTSLVLWRESVDQPMMYHCNIIDTHFTPLDFIAATSPYTPRHLSRQKIASFEAMNCPLPRRKGENESHPTMNVCE